jgi:predicted hydrocarbon binding protein
MNTDARSPGTWAEIPKTGRIGRLAKAIEAQAGHEVLSQVMQDVVRFTSTSSPAQKAAWLRDAVGRLEQLTGPETSTLIMERCGRQCCGATFRKRVKQVMAESTSMGEFLTKLNDTGLGGGRLTLKDESIIAGGYDHCYCGQVKQTEEPFPTLTYCHCSVGWYRQLFESALERPVEVELVQSIISGAESCEFLIRV